MQHPVMDAVPVRFVPGDRDSKRDAFLIMLRMLIGHALAAGFHLTDIARVISIPVTRLVDWATGAVQNQDVEDMTRKCVVLAHGLGLDLEGVADDPPCADHPPVSTLPS